MTTTATFDELEWRSYSIKADVGQVIERATAQSSLALTHYRVLRGLRSVSGTMDELLQMFHRTEHLRALESASPEELTKILTKLSDVAPKVAGMIGTLRSMDLGYWRPLYRRLLGPLENYNRELQSHVESFGSADATLVLLTTAGQHALLKSLQSPPEPNAALRRAFARR
jgi:hypothetical protein